MTTPPALADHEPSGFFALRTPLLPLEAFVGWSEGAGGDPEELRARLRGLIAPAEIREALFVASPDLERSIDSWIEDPEGKRGRRTEHALVRYLARMAGRATPFGLFAGHSVGRLGPATRLSLPERASAGRQSRLDMDYLCTLADTLARDPSVSAVLVYRPNSSLYPYAGRLRYVESRLDGLIRTHHLVSIDASDAARTVLVRAGDGATPEELSTALSAGGEIGVEDAGAFVRDLVAAQVLVPELQVPVTGGDPLWTLVDELGARPETKPAAETLAEAGEAIRRIDAGGIGAGPAAYRAIAWTLSSLPAPVELTRLFQVDLRKPTPDATLGPAVVEEIARAVALLHRLAPGRRDDIDRFRDAFLSRYEGRAVPLVEALDDEVGIGFPPSTDPASASPLLAGLEIGGPAEGSGIEWTPRDGVLLRMLLEALERGDREMVLDAAAIDALATEDAPPLPDAFSVMVSVAASSNAAADAGEFRLLVRSVDGRSGISLMGRFCQADDDLHRLVREHLVSEESADPDAIFAEIVHLPEGRVGNILFRPVLRDHEIPYLGRSGAPRDGRIPVSDLLVSVEGDRIVLRSVRLGRRVVPRLSTAHNYSFRAVPMYRFLCMLQTQGSAAGLRWEWGPLASAPFLPRVSAGRIVVEPARWFVPEAELRDLGSLEGDEGFRAVQSWRERRGLPRLVSLVDGDNLLPVDLDNALSVESFVQLVRARPGVVLEELFPGPDDVFAEGPEGRFVHEAVVPFARIVDEAVASATRAGTPAPRARAVTRTMPPGSGCVYAKLYGPPSFADAVLADVVGPLASEAVSAGDADRWFFIRYADPEPHLRVRLFGESGALDAAVLPLVRDVAAALIREGRIHRLQLDTYEREVERYGGPDGVVLAERLFHADSEAVVDILGRLERGDEGQRERWMLAVVGIDALLSDMGLDLKAKHELLVGLRDGYRREFAAAPPLVHRIGERFRKERPRLESLLEAGPGPSDDPLEPGLEILRSRSERIAPFVAELRRLDPELSRTWVDLTRSFVHMFTNRILRSSGRAHELVLYDFLERLTGSRLARGGGKR